MAISKLTQADIKVIVQRYKWGQSSKQIASDYPVSDHTICYQLRKAGVTLRSKGWSKHEHHLYFRYIDCQEKAYILGIFHADGCNAERGFRLSLAEQDKELVIKIRDCICAELKLIRVNPPGKATQVQWLLLLYGKAVQQRLTELGCFPRKSLTLVFPEWLSNSYTRHFIRGYMDGDGCISINKSGRPRLGFVGTMSFLSSIREIIGKELDIEGGLYRRSRLDLFSICDLQYNGFKKVLPILTWLYKDAAIYMERKYRKYDVLTRIAAKESA